MIGGRAVAVAILFSAVGSAAGYAAGPQWGYTAQDGPAVWSTNYPSCAGREQSPLNIIASQANPRAENRLETFFNDFTPRAYDVGHGVNWDGQDGAAGYIKYEGQPYRVAQFHHHEGSETQLDSEQFAIEQHAVTFGGGGYVAAVLALFFRDNGQENQALSMLGWANMPKAGGPSVVTSPMFNMDSMMPSNMDYYTFMGSLTTPPCTENLRWIVLMNPVSINAAQIAQYSYKGNFRPPQPLYERKVFRLSSPDSTAPEAALAAWDYTPGKEGSEWPSAFPACGGREQSPVDIVSKSVQVNTLNQLTTRFRDYMPSASNDGHTIAFKGAGAGIIVFEQKTYEVMHFHFHAMSETRLDGRQFAMEMQAVCSGEAGLLVLALLFSRENTLNPALSALDWQSIPQVPGAGGPASMFNLGLFYAGNPMTYYKYKGSLTSPPCTQGVQWVVLATPTIVNQEQLSAFPFKNNFRPPQRIFARTIELLTEAPPVRDVNAWGYSDVDGPSTWAGSFPGCGGRQQSPINIKQSMQVRPPRMQNRLQTNTFHGFDVEMTNNGHTVVFSGEDMGYIRFEDEPFRPIQFHFHAGSEHQVESKQYPLEQQIVTLGTGKENSGYTYLIIVNLFDTGADNAALDAAGWQSMPGAEGSTVPGPKDFSLDSFFKNPKSIDYWHYMGSLTSPPCTEGVKFVVIKELSAVSRRQMNKYPVKGNFRPPQLLNGRTLMMNSKAAPAAATKTAKGWGYSADNGPSTWGMQYKSCSKGKEQSPVNIKTDNVVDNGAGRLRASSVLCQPLAINNGFTVQWNADACGYFVFEGQTFEVLHFEFHVGSEHRINNMQYAMEMQIVARSEAGGGSGAGLAVISLLFQKSRANAALVKLGWGAMPQEQTFTAEKTGRLFNMAELFAGNAMDYWQYTGSETTPPCTEGVTFIVIKQPSTVNDEQIAMFPYSGNFRPPQRLFARTVQSGSVPDAGAHGDHDSSHSWGYGPSNGPDFWPEHHPQCGGKEQSPVDIIQEDVVQPAGMVNRLETHFKNYGPIMVGNNGHSLTFTAAAGSPGYTVFEDKLYRPLQFHFHAGSETRVDGKHFPLELHVVHLGLGARAGGRTYLVLGLLFDIGEPNQALSQLNWQTSLPAEMGLSSEAAKNFNIASFFRGNNAYWAYEGSLTTPPCTEGVTWVMMKGVATMSAAQSLAHTSIFPNNFRPPQPLYKRVVLDHSAPAPAAPEVSGAWGYTLQNGPMTWAKLSGTSCGDGKEQSPIDIESAKVQKLDGAKSMIKVESYTVDNINGENTGNTVQWKTPAGGMVLFELGSNHAGGVAPGQDRAYEILHIEFHAGSDHTIDGKQFALEMQVVTRSETGGHLILSLLFNVGLENAGLKALGWDNQPVQPSTRTTAGGWNLGTMFRGNKMDYYKYMGSLTAPPCTESVEWVVLAQTATLSAAQLGKFPFTNNFRPTLPLNHRAVYMNSVPLANDAVPGMWGYDADNGPMTWQNTYSDCDGREQSPVDIVTTPGSSASSAAGRVNRLSTSFTGFVPIASNNGHTVAWGVQPDGAAGYITFEDMAYRILEFHHHAGSETTIDGKQFALEMQTVAVGVGAANGGNTYAILALLFDLGAENSFLNELGWRNMPQSPADGQVTTAPYYDLSDLHPQDMSYYSYKGSLTIPPCTQGVQWIVLRKSVSISRGQLALYPFSRNFRPPMPLFARSVRMLSAPAPPAPPADHSWGYEAGNGPTTWGGLCASGDEQSPINIVVETVKVNTAIGLVTVFNGAVRPQATHNGHTIKFSGDGAGIVVFEGMTYEVMEFNFRAGSGTQINGEQFALEMQVLLSGEAGLAILTLLFQLGEANTALDLLGWSELPTTGVTKFTTASFNMGSFFLDHPMNYFKYKGSLNTPPCTEGIQWIVLSMPTEVSADQVALFKSVVPFDNFRPIQPLGNRVVEYLTVAAEDAHHSATWDYGANGPDTWAATYSGCAGSQQSPIDIAPASVSTAADHVNRLELEFRNFAPKATNNGYTVLWDGMDGVAGYVMFEGQPYRVLEFHFHAGSETTISKKQYALEMQILTLGAGDSAKNSPDAYHYLVVSMLFDVSAGGEPNKALESLGWSNMPQVLDAKATTAPSFNLAQFFSGQMDYYSFMGSLTTPPCTENIRYVMLRAPATVSPAQVALFPFNNNFRPTQPVNGRVVSLNSKMAIVQESGHAHEWGYTEVDGPLTWPSYYPLCGSREQSPVAISHDGSTMNTANMLTTLFDDFIPIAENNAHSVLYGSAQDASMGIIVFEDMSFAVHHFKFHVGSETTLNGKQYGMEMQIVTEGEAGLAVISLLFDKSPSTANAALNQIGWNNIPKTVAKNVATAGSTLFSLDNFFLDNSMDYYFYMGSLTAPPCAEGVYWIVLRESAVFSQDQQSAFPFTNNFRPPQPLFARTVSFLSAASTGTSAAAWGYGPRDGPTTWARNFPDCGGQMQSPINIVEEQKVSYDTNRLKTYFSDFVPIAENNGHTVVFDGDDGGAGYLTFENVAYRILQFHFHVRSETTVNGQQFPMEIQTVCQSDAALGGSGLLILSMLFIESEGSANAGLNALGWEHIPQTPAAAAHGGDDHGGGGGHRRRGGHLSGCAAAATAPALADGGHRRRSAASGGVQTACSFNLANLYTSGVVAYYQFEGSLTTPPCTQGLRWIVLTNRPVISSRQRELFPFTNNFRPPQPLYNRKVYYLSQVEAASSSSAVDDSWGYATSNGPETWSTLFSQCGGSNQAPVDILTDAVVQRGANRLKTRFYSTQAIATNDGHTVKWDGVGAGFLVFEGRTYEVKEFKFHVSSETRLNGLQFPMEMQIVTQAVDGSASDTLVLAVLFQYGRESAGVKSLGWMSMPMQKSATAVLTSQSFDLSSLLPDDMTYFTHAGSLTTPPCTEGVTFVILKSTVLMSNEQHDAFPFANNFRPPQPLFARKVYELSEGTGTAAASHDEHHGDDHGDGHHVYTLSEWGYEAENGPAMWPTMYPVDCAGRSQSPINIPTGDADSTGKLNRLETFFFPIETVATNNGHTVQYDGKNGKAGYIVFEGSIYIVLHFHFHVGSETTLDGKQYAMEMQVVTHSGTDYLILALLFEEGDVANQGLDAMGWSNIPKYAGVKIRTTMAKVSLASLYPSDMHYFSYTGSLTTPPCTEGITWVVLGKTVAISTAQLDSWPEKNNGNFRPTMPLNGRVLSFLSDPVETVTVSTNWGYTDKVDGPFEWGALDQSFDLCSTGQEQSPIDIDTALATKKTANRLRVDTYPFEPKAKNNGHTVQWDAKVAGMLMFEGEAYRIQHFNFHKGSETQIDGRQFDLEMHIVAQAKPGKLLILAMMFNRGVNAVANNALSSLGWANMPQGTSQEKLTTQGSMFNINSFFETINNDMSYYQYRGSLTIPPCTEGVMWAVLGTTAPISQAQLDVFPWCKTLADGTQMPCNYRHPQSLHARVVQLLSDKVAVEGEGKSKADDSYTKAKVEWGYLDVNGPAVWHNLNMDGNMCAGHSQSPINIIQQDVDGCGYSEDDEKCMGDGVRANQLQFAFTDFIAVATNDGHTVSWNGDLGGDGAGYIIFEGNTQRVMHFSFHVASENTINDVQYSMEMQLVTMGSDGKLVVVCLLFDRAMQRNIALDALRWSDMPQSAGTSKVTTRKFNLNAADMLEDDTASYFTYTGSLTTPPCDEGVTFVVLTDPAPLSSDQLMRFPFSNNFRPPQPLYNRVVSFMSDPKMDDAASNVGVWSYMGKDSKPAQENSWAGLGSCGSGRQQSPVNIKISELGANSGVNALFTTFESFEPEANNNGNTIEFVMTNGKNAGYLQFEGDTYRVSQFHFHAASETQIDGVQFAMEMQVLAEGMKGKHLILALLFHDNGIDNPALSSLGWDYIPLTVNAKTKTTNAGETWSLQNLLDAASPTHNNGVSKMMGANAEFNSGNSMEYFRYMGSLTTPPCTEGIQWVVLKNPTHVSARQTDMFKRTSFNHNYRLPQPLNARFVYYMSEVSSSWKAHKSDWGYTLGKNGPSTWATNWATCGGAQQSPVDISDGGAVGQSANRLTPLFQDFKPFATNTGYTIKYHAKGGDGADEPLGIVNFEGRNYRATHFHFHAGSETQIDGHQFALEMQVMAVSEVGKTLVLALLFDVGAHNVALAKLGWNRIPQHAADAVRSTADSFNLAGIYSDVYPAGFDYFSYMGSLTTPPCTEGLTWVVLARAASLTEAQLAVFPYSSNFRPPQPLNARFVYRMSTPASAADDHHGHDWNYSPNPVAANENWMHHFPNCNGKEQSPINIVVEHTVRESDQISRLDTYWSEFQPAVLDNGHTIVFDAFMPEKNGAMGYWVFEGVTYQAIRFEFHEKSETRINGEQFALEMHIVSSVLYPLKYIKDQVGVLAILFKESSRRNDGLVNLGWASLGNYATGQRTESVRPDGTPRKFTIDEFMGQLVSKEYYQFDGSLTAPPCTEGVQWVVMQHSVPVHSSQLAEFKYNANYRPVMPLYARVVRTMSAASSSTDAEAKAWGYSHSNGPAKWAGMEPKCAGMEQSPIDINVKYSIRMPSMRLELGFSPIPRCMAVNNGHAVQWQGDDSGFIVFESKVFRVLHFHFHVASQMQIDGKQYAMEMNVVTYNKDVSCRDKARCDDNILILALLFENTGAPNNALERLGWAKMPTVQHTVTTTRETCFTIGEFFGEPPAVCDCPGASGGHRRAGSSGCPGAGGGHRRAAAAPAAASVDSNPLDYYQFIGSLTTPPCTEGIRWVVMANAVPINQDQVNKYPYASNFRPPMPVGSRIVHFRSAEPTHHADTHDADWGYGFNDAGNAIDDDWNDNFPTCGGLAQSPIDIDPTKTNVRSMNMLSEKFTPHAAKAINNGHTIKFDGHGDGGSGAGFLEFEHRVYRVSHYQFHMSSEIRINKKQFALELQIVTESMSGVVLILAMLFDRDPTDMDNSALKHLGWDHMPMKMGGGGAAGGGGGGHRRAGSAGTVTAGASNSCEDTHDAIGCIDSHHYVRTSGKFNLAEFFVDGFAMDYYHFAGSLTAPPCTEGIRWVVLENTLAVSASQLAKFPYKSHFRPPQPLNCRDVFFLSEKPLTAEELAATGPKSSAAAEIPWGYADVEIDPSKWSTYIPACGGLSQSPVNIVHNEALNHEYNRLKLFFKTFRAMATDNCHTLKWEGTPPAVEAGTGYLKFEGEVYRVLHFHFHAQSQTTFDGNHLPLEMHIVTQNKVDKILVLGLLFDIGPENDALNLLGWTTDKLPNDRSCPAKVADAHRRRASAPASGLVKTADSFSLMRFFQNRNMGYYQYTGSFTTPPCTEGVKYVILRGPATLSESQVNTFIYNNNFRPVQPLNGRMVSLLSEPQPPKAAAVAHNWGYDDVNGPLTWGAHNDACNGHEQSPIDIPVNDDNVMVHNSENKLELFYDKFEASAIRNSHTVKWSVRSGVPGFIVLEGQTWEPMHFQFHRMSETKRNGHQFQLEMQVVHTSAPGEVLVLALLFEIGARNGALSALGWNQMPTALNDPRTTNSQFSIGEFFTSRENMDYYSYMGSLTTPPCTEGVVWIVMKDEFFIDRGQVDVFPFTNNYRPVQPVYMRKVNFLSAGAGSAGDDCSSSGGHRRAGNAGADCPSGSGGHRRRAPAPAANGASSTVIWDYSPEHGPSTWTAGFPGCAGKSQSPIDIDQKNKSRLLYAQTDNRLLPHFVPFTAIAEDTGHAVKWLSDNGEAGFIVFEEVSYQVLQFHFHRGSETTIDGKQFAMEMQIVSQNQKYPTQKLMVLVLLFDTNEGEESELNKGLTALGWADMPKMPSSGRRQTAASFSLFSFFDQSKTYLEIFDYYQFDGSLTTPPCTEGLRWVVLKNPVPTTCAQSNLYPYSDNFRPPQPLNGRKVQHLSQPLETVTHNWGQWGYAGEPGEGSIGAERWADIEPVAFARCRTGQEQSPVNIVTKNVKHLPLNRLVPHFKRFAPYATNNGHTVMWTYNKCDRVAEAAADPPKGMETCKEASAGFLTFEDRAYDVLHFNFNRGSETRINGKQYAMEMKIVCSARTGQLLILSLLFHHSSHRNSGLDILGWNKMPTEKPSRRAGNSEGHSVPTCSACDAAASKYGTCQGSCSTFSLDEFMKPPFKNDYYQHMGSLTTPPCTEGITFVVMKETVPISHDQLIKFPYVANFRPPQPLFARTIDFGSRSSEVHTAAAAAKSDWGYQESNGPMHWAAITGDQICSNGHIQSPINIDTLNLGATYVHNRLVMRFKDFKPFAIHNGHTVEWQASQAGDIDFEDNFFSISKIHFHKSSEHTLNGKTYALEMQILMENSACTGSQLGSTCKLLVIALLFRLSAVTNDGLNQLGWRNMPRTPDEGLKQTATTFNLRNMFMRQGSEAAFDRMYFNYDGSLTTPPCTEGVTWVVMRAQADISNEQVEDFPIPNNARPPMPLHGRTVSEGSRLPSAGGSFDWGYEISNGPLKWTRYYDTCIGSKQSPIDIKTGLAMVRTVNALDLDWRRKCELHMQNNGYTIVVKGRMGETYFEDSTRSRPWNIEQFHFHEPSEHFMNGVQFPLELQIVHQDPVSGDLLLVAVLFEYKEFIPDSAEHERVKEALLAQDAGSSGHRRREASCAAADSAGGHRRRAEAKAAGCPEEDDASKCHETWNKMGTPNCWLHDLGWDNLPAKAGHGQGGGGGHRRRAADATESTSTATCARKPDTCALYYCNHYELYRHQYGLENIHKDYTDSHGCLVRPDFETVMHIPVSPLGALPRNRDYYSYKGSVTTPPCEEKVTWVVMRHTVHISQEQHDKFTAQYSKNFRPPQPVFGRPIQYLSENKFSSAAGTWMYTADTANKVEQEEEWEKMFPTCGGKEQSPVAISLAMSRQNQHNDIKVQFRSTTTGEIYKDARHVQVFVVPEQAGYVSIENNNYQLEEYTFMLPAGTELEGSKFECETLLLTKNVAGAKLMMSIVFNRGPRNMHLSHAGWQEFVVIPEFQRVSLGHAFNPVELLPLNTNYYAYDGSLPWPPCDEGVAWIVFETPMTLSFEQIQAYPYKGSFRPARPLGARVVEHLSRHHSDLIGYGTGSNALCEQNKAAATRRRRVGEATADRSACFDWGYGTHNGPYKWGRYFEKCAALEQSPVNIDTCTQKTRTGNQLQKKWITLENLEIQNDGHNVVVLAPFGETIFEYSTYTVESIAFHLQSEHQLDGHPFLMEMQVLHRNKATGTILNVAVMFQLGPDNNAFLESVHWYELPRVRGTSVSIAAIVNLYDALPAGSGYYTYKGSITAPPCTEGTIWVVMSDLNSMSGLQESQFPFENNYRPPQALNGRDVYFLSEGEDAFDVAYQYKTEWAAGSTVSTSVLSMVICIIASILASCM